MMGSDNSNLEFDDKKFELYKIYTKNEATVNNLDKVAWMYNVLIGGAITLDLCVLRKSPKPLLIRPYPLLFGTLAVTAFANYTAIRNRKAFTQTTYDQIT